MRIYVDPLLAETVPDGTFGGARPRTGRGIVRPVPDPNAAQHFAELAAEVAAIDAARRTARTTTATTERNAA